MRPVWLYLVMLCALPVCLSACTDNVPNSATDLEASSSGNAASGDGPSRKMPALPQKITPQAFAPGLADDAAHPADRSPSGKVLQNDPSAPITTPLCGRALQEANQSAARVFAGSVTLSSSCPRNACFDPLTGTFIAADGQRSICR